MPELTKWLNFAVKPILLLTCSITSTFVLAQPVKQLSLQEAYEAAQGNFTLIKQKGILKLSELLAIKNLNSSLLPQLSFNGQATYQSDVTSVDIPLPGIKIPSQSKDQYRLSADVSQLIYDGGQLAGQKLLQSLSQQVEESRLEVDIFQLKNRISQLYFNILYQDALLKQTDLIIRDVQIGVDKVSAQLAQQTVLRSSLQVLQVQLLQNQQRAIETKAIRQGLTDALAMLTGLQINEKTVFLFPAPRREAEMQIQRPELAVFHRQFKLAEGQLKLIHAKNKPKANLFVQGGYGKPALNLLSNQFDFFYITGLRLNWSLGSLYNKSRDRKLVALSSETKFRELITSDESIIALRNSITESAKVQLENAVISANDYLREINAADLARQALVTHQLQLLQAEINYQITSGKL